MLSPSFQLAKKRKSKSVKDRPSLDEAPHREKRPKETGEEAPPEAPAEAKDPIPAELRDVKIDGIAGGKAPVRAEVPDTPPTLTQSSVISDTSTIAPDESYGNDEVALNGFLRLHPMFLTGLHTALGLRPLLHSSNCGVCGTGCPWRPRARARCSCCRT